MRGAGRAAALGPDDRRRLRGGGAAPARATARSIDERGTLTFAEIDRRSERASPAALAAQGVGAGDGVAILARNHRGFVDATVGVAKLGAHALYLNTMFAAPQITDVCEREEPVAIVHDEEFAELVGGRRRGPQAASSPGRTSPVADGAPTLDDLIDRARRRARSTRRPSPAAS